MLVQVWGEGNALTLLVRMQAGAATLENSVVVPQDIKNIAILWPSNWTTGYLLQWYRCSDLKAHLHPNVHSSNVHSRQTVEGAKMSFKRWMDKEDVVHMYNEILLSHQKRLIPTIYIDIDGTGGAYVKRNKSSRDRQFSYDLTHMWNLRKKTDHRGRERKIKQNEIREGDKP